MKDKWTVVRWITTIAGVIIALGLVFYIYNRQTTNDDIQESLSETVDKTSEYVKDKAAVFKSFGFSEKDAFAQQIEERLDIARDRLAAIKADSTKYSQEKIAELEESISAMEEELQELKDASEDEWQEIRDKAAEKYEELLEYLEGDLS